MSLQSTARGSAAILGLCLCAAGALAQAPVTVHVEIAASDSGVGRSGAADSANVAVWLTPLDPAALKALPAASAKIAQRNKTFEPHVTVIRAGSSIAFPNQDPFFHNVFSLYNGKRFDLGLYEAGASRPAIKFERPGVSYIFCNIHESMSAVVIAVDTPYYGVSDRAGRVEIASVPDGRYTMHVFYERSTADQLKGLDRMVTISGGSRSIGNVKVSESPNVTLAHKNKYGEDYVPAPASGYSE